MPAIKGLLKKYQTPLLYLIFGGLTTLVNIFTYALSYEVLELQNVPSAIIAWFISVLFAFITNKIWVFESKNFSIPVLLKECLSFFICRILSGLLDVAIMYVTVDLMGWNAILWKIIANVIVVILNYAASKILISGKTKILP